MSCCCSALLPSDYVNYRRILPLHQILLNLTVYGGRFVPFCIVVLSARHNDITIKHHL